MEYKTQEGIDDYCSELKRIGKLHLLIDATEWADYMEKMATNYVGPPLPMEWQQLSPEGTTFLVKFWKYGDQLHRQIESETS